MDCICFIKFRNTGIGSKGIIPVNVRDFEECLEMGMDWTLREGYSWPGVDYYHYLRHYFLI